uniref:RNA-binding S4 domain-containing protein n=1 Tax=viral metagenome TaxID=1070528 RepID=A0A6M3KE05_9ZZZZ
MTAFEYLKSLPHLPVNTERGINPPSNSDLKRWLNKGSVIINGVKPKPEDEIEFPITELVFFPKGRRTTMIQSDEVRRNRCGGDAMFP